MGSEASAMVKLLATEKREDKEDSDLSNERKPPYFIETVQCKYGNVGITSRD